MQALVSVRLPSPQELLRQPQRRNGDMGAARKT
jgi:hypothetical protein